MAMRDMTPSRGYAPSDRLSPPREREPAPGDLRSQGQPQARAVRGVAAPVLHLSAGASSPERLRLLRCFNEERDYVTAREILEAGATQMRRFQEYSLLWIFDVLNGSPGAKIHRRLAERYQASLAQRAAFVENVAFELLMTGRWEEAKAHCEGGLKLYPTSQGIWINQLVAMSRMGQHAAVEEVLVALPGIVDIDGGLLGVYLHEEPDFMRPVCNGG